MSEKFGDKEASDEEPLKQVTLLTGSYDFNPIGEQPYDKSSRLLGYHAHGLVYKPHPEYFIGGGDAELIERLHPANVRFLLLRDLGDIVESSANFIGEKVGQKGPRDKALGLQMPFFAFQNPEERPGLTVAPATTVNLLLRLKSLFAQDPETKSIIAHLLGSPLTKIDHSGGIVLEIPGIYDRQTVGIIREIAEYYSTTKPAVEVLSPVPFNAALQMAMWRMLTSVRDSEITRSALVLTDHPGFRNSENRLAIKSVSDHDRQQIQQISFQELPLLSAGSGDVYEGIRMTTMAFRKRGSTLDYTADLMRRMQAAGIIKAAEG